MERKIAYKRIYSFKFKGSYHKYPVDAIKYSKDLELPPDYTVSKKNQVYRYAMFISKKVISH